MRWIALILLSSSSFASVSRSPSGDGGATCSSHPCTFTHTCAGSTCTNDEWLEVSSITANQSQLGDTIVLEAGKRYEADSDIWQIGAQSGTGILTVTTSGTLPCSNCRITPASLAQMPLLVANTVNIPAIFVVGDETDAPAENISIIGLAFTVESGSNYVLPPLLVGDYGDFKADPRIDDPTDEPDNIVIDRCLFINDFLQDVSRGLWLNSRTTTVKNSWLDGWYGPQNESQSLATSANGPGPMTFQNLFVGNASENIFLTAGGSYKEARTSGVLLEHSYIPKVPERIQTLCWVADRIVFQGSYSSPSATCANSTVFRAQNTGTTGSAEPTWPGSGTVADNDITWEKVADWPDSKNSFEIKDAEDVTLRYNVFDGGADGDGGQGNIVTFKAANEGYFVTANCLPWRTGTVNVLSDSVTVEWVSGDKLPTNINPADKNGIVATDFVIDGTTFTISDFVPLNNGTLTLTSTAPAAAGVTFEYGFEDAADDKNEGCRMSVARDIDFYSNVIRHGPQCLVIGFVNQNNFYEALSSTTIRDNLCHDIDSVIYADQDGGRGSNFQFWRFEFHGLNFQFLNNTAFDFGSTMTRSMLLHSGSGNPMWGVQDLSVDGGFPLLILNNIMETGSNNVAATADGCVQGDACFLPRLNKGDPIPDTQLAENLYFGADLDLYLEGGNSYNCCPSSGTACAVDWDCDGTRLVWNFDDGVQKIHPDSPRWHSGTDGKSIGANFDKLPLIRNINVTPTDTEIIVGFTVSEPIQKSGYEAVLLVSTMTDRSDPTAFYTGESGNIKNGRRWTIVATGLTAGTSYYLWLMAGGDAWPPMKKPSFDSNSEFATTSTTTLASLSATSTIGVSLSYGGNVHIEHGTSYDPSTDSIGSPTDTSDEDCTSGCTISVRTNKGLLYHRLEETGGASNVWPVKAALIR